ncbi:hypothetical protein [Pantoea agglomerans]|uniref:hypothetical protein n=1 Tax=Enterobacter agglomerans TaxID=549 RepID=UPI0013BC16DF|nr:hypothetical protein [Pantoea agglomerans]NEG57996.1 hypothetical protein [Pantoea agglomerans]NEG99710.1 hypothetical protein [Pantoea agglomerans]NEH04328.1 hypothetical protein [Pantoea agglomerans]NEH14269.1 hypothetical protein [Pantoea agglomerans]
MNKLTAESARQELTKLKVWENDGVLTLKEERYLQALEIALSILEQQERGEDWIEWGGGECPVGNLFSDTVMVIEVRFRTGNTERSSRPESYSWERYERATDIIAYRIIPEQPTNQNGEQ